MSCFEPGVEHSDASYIDVSKVVCVFTCVCKHVYVTQRISLPLFLGPTENSIEDMIWLGNVPTIVMLTRIYEGRVSNIPGITIL